MTIIFLILIILYPKPIPHLHTGYAVRHTKLVQVARARGMDTTGMLFASPLVPLGTRLCVSSKAMPRRVCGVVVDICQPRDCAWQRRERRIIEVTPELARRLCIDPTGLPRHCPVTVEVER